MASRKYRTTPRREPAARRGPQPPLTSVRMYREAQPLIQAVRAMERFFEEAVSRTPGLAIYYGQLYETYVKILGEEIGPHAVNLAMAIMDLEDAYPEIQRTRMPKKRQAQETSVEIPAL